MRWGELSRCFESVWDEAGKSRRKKSAVSVIFVSRKECIYFLLNQIRITATVVSGDKEREVGATQPSISDK